MRAAYVGLRVALRDAAVKWHGEKWLERVHGAARKRDRCTSAEKSTRKSHLSRRLRPSQKGRFCLRQGQPERAASAQLAFHRKGSTMQHRQLFSDGQPQTQSAVLA